jgi:hypothetical protein
MSIRGPLVTYCLTLSFKNAMGDKDMQYKRGTTFSRGVRGEKDRQRNRVSTLLRGVRHRSRPAARDQEKMIANAIQGGESKSQRS